jgi:hypothetical protein
MSSSKKFYSRLPVVHYSLNQLLRHTNEFQSIPDDWFVILTDIVNSTEHFKDERYQEVNFVAVAGASIVLNEAHLHRIHVPFVYGGDGVTVFVPPALVPSLKTKLATLRSNAHKRFGMNLRISIIPVSEIYKAGFSIRTAKLYISKSYNQSIFLGEGIRYAESLMKKTEEYLLPQHIKQRPIDLSGLECKWNALFPPRSGDEILSLIVLPHGHREPEEVFHDVLEKIDELYGTFAERHPIHSKTLSPTTNMKTILHASHLKYGSTNIYYVVGNLLFGIYKSIRIHLKDALYSIFKSRSMPEMSTSSDTLKIDNTMKTIFAGAPEQRPKLIKWLAEQEKKGELFYGINVANSSMMTCYIKNSQDNHVRFLDGFGGGYTLASIELKKKLKRLN